LPIFAIEEKRDVSDICEGCDCTEPLCTCASCCKCGKPLPNDENETSELTAIRAERVALGQLLPDCMIGPSEPCGAFQQQTAEIDRLRAELAAARAALAPRPPEGKGE
jgi:hypothetical protein